MNRFPLLLLALLFGLAFHAEEAFAQSESDFVTAFAGRWQTLDPVFADKGACQIELSSAKVGQSYAVSTQHCAAELAAISQWSIVDKQLALLGPDMKIAARLGGNQNRMSGDLTTGVALVFERLPANLAAGSKPNKPLKAGCIYYGYTATCALPADMVAPATKPAGSFASAATLVRLNARSEARPDAPVLATIPANTCVAVEQCSSASDGLWCKAKIGNFSAWIPQISVRANRWQVLTFHGSCS